MSDRKLAHTYEDIISIKNLLEAWREFTQGKKARADVQEFELRLMSNIFSLHQELAAKTYRHSPYEAFNISDPKPRNIHKANVRDRLLHHALYRKLYPFFDDTFISTSYSCRKWKGGHKAINKFRSYAYQVSRNHTRTVWVLKCDIRKFFASIDHACLIKVLRRQITDKDILWLINEIIESFYSTEKGVGLPLGNLTSQLLVNIYMNEFDQFVKRRLKAKCYIRYADDFIFISADKKWLQDALPYVKSFLWDRLCLTLHSGKVSIHTLASGVDFLGWAHFPDHRVLRTSTKWRMSRRLTERKGSKGEEETKQSYVGMLRHGNTYQLQQKIDQI